MNDGPAGFLLGGLFGALIAFVFAVNVTERFYKQQAVKAGVALYAVDPTTGEVKFEYRTIPVVP